MNLADLFNALPDDRSLRRRRLVQFVEGWWGALAPSDGVPEEELRAAEARLGTALPSALREAYVRLSTTYQQRIADDGLTCAV